MSAAEDSAAQDGQGHPLAGRRILVTGAEGLIGSAVCARLAAAGASITGLSLSDYRADHHDQLPPTDLDRVVHGDATDVQPVADALTDVDLVVHLAAIPNPNGYEQYTVFRTNVNATFNVLNQAAQRGIRRAVIASSINATGLTFNSHPVLPSYYPIDETMPSDLDEAYSLSKYVDEITAATMHRHWGIDVVALRFPFTQTAEAIARHSQHVTEHPEAGVVEGWSYLDVRDAARAVELALLTEVAGAIPIFVAADDTLLPYPTDDLLDRYAPGVLRNRPFIGREVPMELTRARKVLGFRAEHRLALTEEPLG